MDKIMEINIEENLISMNSKVLVGKYSESPQSKPVFLLSCGVVGAHLLSWIHNLKNTIYNFLCIYEKLCDKNQQL